ncbi:hypothetical protein ACFW6V_21005 [Streptomyces sp. NPDC058734]|uniref:hypothetical protein n=1 Tax=Streptomyces sp. NPDC058734 TaxID=3346615 RepID=UPI003694D2F1
MVGDERPDVRAEALWAVDRAFLLSPQRLIPAIAPLAADWTAARLRGKIGPAAAEAGPLLAELAVQPDDEAADQALAALVLVAPQAAAPLLARALGRRPRAMQCATGSHAPADSPFLFDAELFAAVRARLAAKALEGPEGRKGCGCPTTADHNDTAALVYLLRLWGPRAARALPELCAVLPRFDYAATAITSVAAGLGPERREEAAAALRAGAGKLFVAQALHELTGESGPLFAAAEAALTAGSRAASRAPTPWPVSARLPPASSRPCGRRSPAPTTVTPRGRWTPTSPWHSPCGGSPVRCPKQFWYWHRSSTDVLACSGPAGRPPAPPARPPS